MHIYIMNINFILAGSNNNNFPVEKEFPLNTEPNDNLSLNIEPVEDLNNTSFSNGFLSSQFDRQSVDMIFQIVRKGTEAAIKVEQAAKEALIISERNQNTLAEISEQVLRFAKTSQDSWWQLPHSKTYMEIITEKVFPKGSPSNDSTAFTMAVVELFLDPCSGTVDMNKKIVVPKMLIYLNHIDEEQESDC
ncbi:unnamed protein product [Rhizophagus irregularis]|nr:unnamed protein product [Rhizophagus irregularis]